MNPRLVPSDDPGENTPAGTGSDRRPARPQALPVRPENIPAELARYQQWVGWSYRWDGQAKAWKKPPRSPRSGGPASVTNPATWGSVTEALDRATHPHCDGTGFVLTTEDPFVALDLDHCISPNQQIAPWALAIVDTLNSYTERSPSGHGLRIFLRGTLPKPGCRQGPVELYGSGRHVTVTGHHLEGTPTTIEQRDVELTAGYRSIFGDPAPTKEPLTGSSGRGAVAKPHPLSTVPSAATWPSDDRVLQQAVERYGERVRRLYAGDIQDYDDDHSRADLAFLALLTPFTQDRAQLDRLLRSSELYREKWERPDYQEETIERALDWNGGPRVARHRPPACTEPVSRAVEPGAAPSDLARQLVARGRWAGPSPGDEGLHERRCRTCGNAFVTKRGMGGSRYCRACRKQGKRSTGTRQDLTFKGDTESKNAIRQRVLRQSQQKCRACGQRAYDVAYLVPPAQGGAYTVENLMAVCGACRNVAPHLAFPDIEAKVGYIRKSRKLR